MKNLTTPKSILYGFIMVALAIASLPYSSNLLINEAHAQDMSGVAAWLENIHHAITTIDCSR